MWQLNAYGFRVQVDTGLNLFQATDLWLRMQRPDGTLIDRIVVTADITNAVEGIISLPIVEGDLNQVGWYHMQVIDKTPGRYLPSGILRFTVEKSL